MNVPFVSGSAHFDAMAIVPCSMGTLAGSRAATAETTILRAADVFLKERRQADPGAAGNAVELIHARNVVTLIEAGATVLRPRRGSTACRGRWKSWPIRWSRGCSIKWAFP